MCFYGAICNFKHKCCHLVNGTRQITGYYSQPDRTRSGHLRVTRLGRLIVKTERVFVLILLLVLCCGLPGHMDRKGLRRERGERVILHFIFHYSQPFVMTPASTLYLCGFGTQYLCVCK